MQQLAISVLVVVMMLAIGLRTSPSDFAEVREDARSLFWVVVANVLVAPLLALAALSAVEVAQPIAVGVLICAAAPGGPTGPLFAMHARGHVAKAVTAMIVLVFLSVLTAPLTLTLLLGVAVDVGATDLIVPMIGTLFAFQLVPLGVGMSLRRRWPERAARASIPMDTLANVLLVAVIVGLLAAKGAVLLDMGGVVIGVCIGLVCANVLLGAATGRDGPGRRSFAMVTGVRNLSVSLLIAAAYFPDPMTDAAILTFGLFTMVLPFGAARVLGRAGATG